MVKKSIESGKDTDQHGKVWRLERGKNMRATANYKNWVKSLARSNFHSTVHIVQVAMYGWCEKYEQNQGGAMKLPSLRASIRAPN